MYLFVDRGARMRLDERMNIFERVVGGRRYRIASQSVWDPGQQRPFARQAVLGSADEPPVADLGLTRTLGTRGGGEAPAPVCGPPPVRLIQLIPKAPPTRGAPEGPAAAADGRPGGRGGGRAARPT